MNGAHSELVSVLADDVLEKSVSDIMAEGDAVLQLPVGMFFGVSPKHFRPGRSMAEARCRSFVIQNDSLGLAIDCETATAHWHGERIDYDHALMVAMASWDSGDTRPEAGPAAGDWNPS